jgi:F420H(2)-dependent biliverdin reductase
VAFDLENLPESFAEFVRTRHLATLTTLRADGSPHVAPVGFSYDPVTRIARVIASAGVQKVLNIERGGPGELGGLGGLGGLGASVVICQVDGGRWISLEGKAVVTADPERVAEACLRYEARYQAPRPNPKRVAIEIQVERILGRLG